MKRPKTINQSADKRRLRGLDLGAVLLITHKPISGKVSETLQWPHQIDRALDNARRYAKRHPTSYQPAYRVNIYPKGPWPVYVIVD